MEQQILSENFGSELISKIKNNVFLVETEEKEKRILKTKRKFSLNLFNTLRFSNEYRIYEFLSRNKSSKLNVPQFYEGQSKDLILMDYVRSDDTRSLDLTEFMDSYIHLQRLEIPEDHLLDLYNQIGRGFLYRICGVSIATLSSKVGIKLSLKTLLLFSQLSFKAKSLENKYWFHGDLNKNNFFYNKKDRQLYFIDFENMFYSRKWPLAEIISRAFAYEGEKVVFNIEWIQRYFERLPENSEIKKVCVRTQFRFALLHHSVHEIAQTKIEKKREEYTDLLKLTTDKRRFNTWFNKNVEGRMDI